MKQTIIYSIRASSVLCATTLLGLLLMSLLHNPSVGLASTPGDTRPGDTAQPKQVSYSPECGPDWQVGYSPNAALSDNYLNGVDGIASNSLWAVGRYGNGSDRTLVEYWNGGEWLVAPS